MLSNSSLFEWLNTRYDFQYNDKDNGMECRPRPVGSSFKSAAKNEQPFERLSYQIDAIRTAWELPISKVELAAVCQQVTQAQEVQIMRQMRETRKLRRTSRHKG